MKVVRLAQNKRDDRRADCSTDLIERLVHPEDPATTKILAHPSEYRRHCRAANSTAYTLAYHYAAATGHVCANASAGTQSMLMRYPAQVSNQ
jgi:hypothetical protein